MSLSVWEKESFYAPSDVLIVGSGFVGLWSAYYLKKRNRRLNITVIDRGVIPTGASTRNAGFACFGSVTELMSDMEKMGEDGTLEIVEMRYRGLQKIRKIFNPASIGYEALGGYELITASQSFGLDMLRSNIDRLNLPLKKITRKKAFYLNDDRIHSFGFSGVQHLVENCLEGQLHSGKLCMALLQLVQSMGVRVLNNIEVAGMEKANGRIELDTKQGFRLVAERLLLCTNAFAKQLIPSLDVEPARGQVLVTSPLPSLKFKGTFHYDEGFYYFRNLGNRILLGGARNKAFEEEHSYEMDTTDRIQQELERFLRETILPGEDFSVDHRWSGIMGIGQEKKPIVAELQENVFCALRMSGMGVALAPEIGKIMAKKISA